MSAIHIVHGLYNLESSLQYHLHIPCLMSYTLACLLLILIDCILGIDGLEIVITTIPRNLIVKSLSVAGTPRFQVQLQPGGGQWRQRVVRGSTALKAPPQMDDSPKSLWRD